ncbi:hypothetical protein V8D89_009447 [Ganoderma adspersum]
MFAYSNTTNNYWKPVLPKTPASDAYRWVTGIPSNVTIHKERAVRMYLFHPSDLDGVPFNDGFNPTTRHYFNEYKERDRVEGLGGSRLKRAMEKSDLRSNLLPTDYRVGARYDLPLSSPPKLQDRYVCKSRVLSDAKLALAPWIWDTCNIVLDYVLLDGAIPRAPEDLTGAREDAMERAVVFVDSQRKLYARRPEEPLQPTSSIKALLRLRRVLEQAPLAPVPGTALWGTPFPGLDFIRKTALVEDLGTGRDGWRTVRWEVYDKYSQSPSFGFWYDMEEKAWIDNGTDWLDYRRHSRKELQLQGHTSLVLPPPLPYALRSF